MKPDVVYPIKCKGDELELRYSLRSLKNIPHGKVYIVGEIPFWAKNVVHVEVKQRQAFTRFQNAAQNILAACKIPELTTNFILMNDDFYIVRPLKKIPTMHRGTIQEVLDNEYSCRTSQYIRILRRTNELLLSLKQPNQCYELHVPMIINKGRYIELERVVGQRHNIPYGATRSLYGNMNNIGGIKTKDVKVYRPEAEIPDSPFISSGPATMTGMFLEYLKGTFPEKSEYEK